MSVKNDIRSELEAHRGEDISGQYLAEKLGVSRNAVWKAINSLKNDGYKITSSTNKGTVCRSPAIFSRKAPLKGFAAKIRT